MEYFVERNGIYRSRNISRGMGSSPVIRIALTLLPFLIMGGIWFSMSGKGDLEPAQMIPVIIAASVFIFANLLSFSLRRLGFSSGITVDQMNGTVTFRRTGGTRHSVPMGSLREIGLMTMGAGGQGFSPATARGGMLYLMTGDGQKHVVAVGKDVMKLRMVADELSVLTSTTVNEVQGTGQGITSGGMRV